MSSARQSPFIEGLALTYVSTTQARLEIGSAYIPAPDDNISVTAPITFTMLTGIDALAFVYLYEDPLNPGIGLVELSTQAPAAPYAGTACVKGPDAAPDNTRRYLGMLRNNAGEQLIRFDVEGSGSSLLYTYATTLISGTLEAASHTGTVDVRTYQIGPSAPTAAKRLVSPRAQTAILQIETQSTEGFISYPNAPAGMIRFLTNTLGFVPAVHLSPTQEFTAIISTDTGRLYAFLLGYYERR